MGRGAGDDMQNTLGLATYDRTAHAIVRLKARSSVVAMGNGSAFTPCGNGGEINVAGCGGKVLDCESIKISDLDMSTISTSECRGV